MTEPRIKTTLCKSDLSFYTRMVQETGLAASTSLFLTLLQKYPSIGRGRRLKLSVQLPWVQNALSIFFIALINCQNNPVLHCMVTTEDSVQNGGYLATGHRSSKGKTQRARSSVFSSERIVNSQGSPSSSQMLRRRARDLLLSLITCSSGNHLTFNLVFRVNILPPEGRNTGNLGLTLGLQAMVKNAVPSPAYRLASV